MKKEKEVIKRSSEFLQHKLNNLLKFVTSYIYNNILRKEEIFTILFFILFVVLAYGLLIYNED